MRIALCVGLAVMLARGHQAPAGARDVAKTREGSLVTVGDHRLYMECRGPETTPVVIFESGGGGTSADWDDVRSQLPASLRSCAYDRAGSGRSEAGPRPRTLHQEAFELQALLRAARVQGPYVLVGQSLGGVLVRLLTDSIPESVVGVVLVEPTHESAVLGSARYGGMARLREKAVGRPIPPPRLDSVGASPADPEADYLAEEFALVYAARQKVPQPLGSRPLVVLGGGKRPPPPPGITADTWASLRAEREAQVRELAALSSNSRFVQDAASGHSLHRDNPGLVVQSIQDVVRAAANGSRLTP